MFICYSAYFLPEIDFFTNIIIPVKYNFGILVFGACSNELMLAALMLQQHSE